MNIAQRIISRDFSRDRAEMGRQITLTLKSAVGGGRISYRRPRLNHMCAVLLVPQNHSTLECITGTHKKTCSSGLPSGGIVGGVFGWWLSSHRH